jgi:hypothetical protein
MWIDDSTELHSAIKASCDAGEMVDSGYILWYLGPGLQGQSNQNVDEPSEGPESPNGHFSNGRSLAASAVIAIVMLRDPSNREGPFCSKAGIKIDFAEALGQNDTR